ncbi:hypothetical protein MAR_028162 [Mya arenaria]|uniref:F5/8 type C domain-containing protein n=2 Tax=Mya arenaria TaxID=6604 RepID=A0ABY7DCT7_MYAAR|nr:hypothetical protein MAR_028162 [Mya arenaria]
MMRPEYNEQWPGNQYGNGNMMSGMNGQWGDRSSFFENGGMMRGDWSSARNNRLQYYQFVLKEQSNVKAIVTKSWDNGDGYNQNTFYRMSYSMDCENWHTVQNSDGLDRIFGGKQDSTEYGNTNWFTPALRDVKCVRINPISWYNNMRPRFQLLRAGNNCGNYNG